MAKSLIIGLGGAGSRIVNYIARELKKKNISTNSDDICCVATSAYECDCKNNGKEGNDIFVLETLKDRMIDAYMKMYKSDNIDEWMPISEQLRREGMLNYVGGLRTKSRLALYDTIMDGTIKELEANLEKLTKDNGEKVNVYIISSIAGGSGSGMLIQMAMWIRKYFASKHTKAIINGVLILPDILINAITSIREDEYEIRALCANAYAVVREINAITKAKAMGHKVSGTIKLDEVGFNSDNEGDGEFIFDYAYLMDDKLESGIKYKSIVDYEKAVADAVYMQVLLPEEKGEVQNMLHRLVLGSDDPLYGSFGVSKAIYPIESVLKYCALRATQDNLHNGWQEIGNIIRLEKESENGDDIEPRKEYIRQFDALSQKPSNKLLYDIKHQVKNGADKIEKFIELLYNAPSCNSDEDENAVAENIAEQLFPSNMDMTSANPVISLITEKDENDNAFFIHPIAIRYILYKLDNRLEEMRKLEKSELLSKVSCAISDRIYIFLKLLEHFFNDFDKLYEKIDDNILRNIRETEKGQENTFYIYASDKEKEDLYKSLNLNTNQINNDLNKVIAETLYGVFCAKQNPNAHGKSQYAGISVTVKFAKEIIDSYTKIIMDEHIGEIDLDLYTAVCKSSDFEYKREHGCLEENARDRQKRHVNAIKSLAEKLRGSSSPFLNVSDDLMYDFDCPSITIWGFSPKLVESCLNLGNILGVNVDVQANELFGKNELCCYKEIYGIPAKDIDKFNELKKDTEGNYYNCYEKIICTINNQVANGNEEALVLTPHIDKTWHNILPFISPDAK